MDPSPQVLGIEVLLRFRDSNTRTQGEDYGVEPIVARPKGDSETVRTYSIRVRTRDSANAIPLASSIAPGALGT